MWLWTVVPLFLCVNINLASFFSGDLKFKVNNITTENIRLLTSDSLTLTCQSETSNADSLSISKQDISLERYANRKGKVLTVFIPSNLTEKFTGSYRCSKVNKRVFAALRVTIGYSPIIPNIECFYLEKKYLQCYFDTDFEEIRKQTKFHDLYLDKDNAFNFIIDGSTTICNNNVTTRTENGCIFLKPRFLPDYFTLNISLCLWKGYIHPRTNILFLQKRSFCTIEYFKYFTKDIVKPSPLTFLSFNASAREAVFYTNVGEKCFVKVNISSKWGDYMITKKLNKSGVVKLSQLHPYTNYTVQFATQYMDDVSGESQGLFSNWSQQLQVSTNETFPSAPEKLTFGSSDSADDNRSVIVYWRGLTERQMNGELVSYRLTVNSKPFTLSVGERQYRLPSISRNSVLIVQLAAENGAGVGDSLILQFPGERDLLPRARVHVMGGGGTDVKKVKVLLPRGDYGRVNLTLWGFVTGDSTQSESVDLPMTSLTRFESVNVSAQFDRFGVDWSNGSKRSGLPGLDADWTSCVYRNIRDTMPSGIFTKKNIQISNVSCGFGFGSSCQADVIIDGPITCAQYSASPIYTYKLEVCKHGASCYVYNITQNYVDNPSITLGSLSPKSNYIIKVTPVPMIMQRGVAPVAELPLETSGFTDGMVAAIVVGSVAGGVVLMMLPVGLCLYWRRHVKDGVRGTSPADASQYPAGGGIEHQNVNYNHRGPDMNGTCNTDPYMYETIGDEAAIVASGSSIDSHSRVNSTHTTRVYGRVNDTPGSRPLPQRPPPQRSARLSDPPAIIVSSMPVDFSSSFSSGAATEEASNYRPQVQETGTSDEYSRETGEQLPNYARQALANVPDDATQPKSPENDVLPLLDLADSSNL